VAIEASPRIRLLEVDPDLGRFLPQDDLAEARQVIVPVITLGRDDETTFPAKLRQHNAFAAILLHGMVLEQMQVGEHVGMRLLGPGDIVASRGELPSMLVADVSARALNGTRLALLGGELLLASRRWPGLTRGFYARFSQQADRLAAQLVICQLPRVDQRLLAVMWLLAESWGRVTPAGTSLPLKLTHDVLGALIGARRPTVTLALRDLTERGALVRQDSGWLLLEPPTEAARPLGALRAPALLGEESSGWSDDPAGAEEEDAVSLELLRDRLNELSARHAADHAAFDERLRTLAQIRQGCRESLERVRRDRLKRSRVRSS
jgi:CRP-like cAMP-binding protein